MTVATSAAPGCRGPGGLKARVQQIERWNKAKALGLVLPLLIFLFLLVIIPISFLMVLSVRNPEIPSTLPATAEAIAEWDGIGLPSDDMMRLFATELREAWDKRAVGTVARRLNYDISGFRSLLMRTARLLPEGGPPTAQMKTYLISIDERWGETAYWLAIQRGASPWTDFYLLAALDLERDSNGLIVGVPVDQAIYTTIIVRTFYISFVVTLICLALGYPLAYLLATLPPQKSNVLMFLVLIPFYTSLLVRTTAWLVLLQENGLVNDVLQFLHLADDRVQLVHNRFGVYVGLVHILLPFMVLPIYSVMKGIPDEYMRAARSLGSGPAFAFRRVYLPLTYPGVAAGSLLVFIISLGYYITPALLGGPQDQFVSYYIAYYTNQAVNWGMAAALSTVLLVVMICLFLLYNRFVGFNRVQIG